MKMGTVRKSLIHLLLDQSLPLREVSPPESPASVSSVNYQPNTIIKQKNNEPYSKIIAIELILFAWSFTIATIIGLSGFEFYPSAFLVSGVLLGSITTFSFLSIKQRRGL